MWIATSSAEKFPFLTFRDVFDRVAVFHQVGRINESEVQSWGPEPPNSHQPHMCISFRSASCGPVVTYLELIYWGSTKFNWWNWELHSSSDGRKNCWSRIETGKRILSAASVNLRKALNLFQTKRSTTLTYVHNDWESFHAASTSVLLWKKYPWC